MELMINNRGTSSRGALANRESEALNSNNSLDKLTFTPAVNAHFRHEMGSEYTSTWEIRRTEVACAQLVLCGAFA